MDHSKKSLSSMRWFPLLHCLSGCQRFRPLLRKQSSRPWLKIRRIALKVYGHLLLPLNRHDSRLQPLRQKVQTLGEVVLYLKTDQQNCERSGLVACPEGMQHAFEPGGTYIPRRLFLGWFDGTSMLL